MADTNTIVEVRGGAPLARGVVMESVDGTIILDRVPIVTPNCEVVVSSISLQVRMSTVNCVRVMSTVRLSTVSVSVPPRDPNRLRKCLFESYTDM